MNVLRGALESSIVERIGWTLLHFVWEGAAVAVLLALVLAALRRRGAGLRYVIACGAFVALAALPAATFVLLPAGERNGKATAVAAPIPLAPAKIHTPPAGGAERGPGAVKPAGSPRGEASLVHLQGGPGARMTPDARGLASAGGAEPQAGGEGVTATVAQWTRAAVERAVPALPWVVVGWGLGVLLLSAWNLGGWAAMRRLRSRATGDVSDEVAHSAARLSGRMGVRRAVRVLQSAVVDSPMVIGAIKPVILLPASLLTGLSPAQLDALLAHELAHVRRHDYLVNLMQGVIETVLFYHPAVWWVSRRIRVEREHCCDDAVVALTADRAAYVGALAAVAEAATGRLSGAAARLAPAANGGTLLARVRRVLGMPDADAARSPRWVAGLVAMALCVLAATAVVTGQDKPAAKDKDFDVPADKVLELEVVDQASGEPMPAVTLSVRLDNQTRAFSTDGQGRARIEYPPAAKYVGVTVKPDGYVPTQVQWRSHNTKDPVPDRFTVEMEKGTTIGGVVQDESGKPIAGVTVQMIIRRKNEEGGQSRVSTAIWDQPVKTDEDGRWRFDLAPRDVDDPWIRLSHPDYLSDEMYGMTPKPPMAKLRDQTGVMVLKKGVALAGRVVDDKGNPIAGAKVMQGSDRFGSHYPETRTDQQGNFRFAQVRRERDVVLTVTAKGRAPDQKTIRVERDTTDVEFRLEPGRVVKGRVVDPQGNPIQGVMIATDTWRGNRALMFRTNTDGDGRWTWNEAPADEVLTDLLKQGFMDSRRVPIRPSEQEQTFTIRPPLRVTGTVTDAETGKPVDGFRVIEGSVTGPAPRQPTAATAGEQVYWDRRAGVPKNGGRFEFEVTYPRPGYAVRIEADGYLPADSRVFGDADGPTVSLEFKMKRGQGLGGVVRGPDGRPAAGAEVVLVLPRRGAYIRNGEMQQRRDNVVVQTDNAGRYRLPPQTGAFALVVLHDGGYAEVKSDQVATSGDVTLEAWGRVTGVARAGSKPRAGEMLTLSRNDAAPADPNAPRAYHDLQAQAGADGRFTFERVPPGKGTVSVQVKLSENSTGYVQSTPVDVKAGQTVEVKVGGTGRPVVGRVLIPESLKGKVNWANGHSSFSTRVKVARPKLPDNWDEMDPAAQQKWGEAYQASPEGRAQQALYQSQKHFAVRVGADGTFRTEDVPAGTYQMGFVINGPWSADRQPPPEPLAMGGGEFTIPEIAGGQSDEPFDVGEVRIKAVRRLNVGDPAPEIQAVGVDGKPVRLADYRGKHVLAYFWGPWAPLKADAPKLKAVHAIFGRDDRLAMVGVVTDERPDEPEKFAARQPVAWTHAFVNETARNELAMEWGLRTMPAAYLIGPDGKVLAKDLKADGLEAALRAALGEPRGR